MLVLSRKLGEKIVIGHDVVVTVLEVRKDTVKLGVDAPRAVTVHRMEIYEEICRANQEANVVTTQRDATDAALLEATQWSKPAAVAKPTNPVRMTQL